VIGLLVWPVGVGKKKKNTKSNGKCPPYANPLSVVPHQPNFACEVVSRISFSVSSFIKIGWKMWELWGVEISASLVHRLYNTCCYRTSRDKNPWMSFKLPAKSRLKYVFELTTTCNGLVEDDRLPSEWDRLLCRKHLTEFLFVCWPSETRLVGQYDKHVLPIDFT